MKPGRTIRIVAAAAALFAAPGVALAQDAISAPAQKTIGAPAQRDGSLVGRSSIPEGQVSRATPLR